MPVCLYLDLPVFTTGLCAEREKERESEQQWGRELGG